jgi:hypothetical protein
MFNIKLNWKTSNTTPQDPMVVINRYIFTTPSGKGILQWYRW